MNKKCTPHLDSCLKMPRRSTFYAENCSKLWHIKTAKGAKVWKSLTKIQVLTFRFPSHQITPKILCLSINSISPREDTLLRNKTAILHHKDQKFRQRKSCSFQVIFMFRFNFFFGLRANSCRRTMLWDKSLFIEKSMFISRQHQCTNLQTMMCVKCEVKLYLISGLMRLIRPLARRIR